MNLGAAHYIRQLRKTYDFHLTLIFQVLAGMRVVAEFLSLFSEADCVGMTQCDVFYLNGLINNSVWFVLCFCPAEEVIGKLNEPADFPGLDSALFAFLITYLVVS